MVDKLNNLPVIKNDPGQVGESLDRLADQLRDGWHQARSLKMPVGYRRIENIAVCGMGGSHLGADIVRSVLKSILPIPIDIIADYNLPKWVGVKTLVMVISYSGQTEETIAALKTARQRRAKIVVITTGGKLADLASQYRLPLAFIKPTANPSGQPRLGVAYSMMAILMCWQKLKLIKISESDIQRLSMVAWEATKRFGRHRPLTTNPAKKVALAWQNRIPLLIGAEWTAGNLHALNNQINENAKTFVEWKMVPDLNHHLLEGLRNRKITKQINALMIIDRAYHPRTQRRLAITAKIIKRLGADVSTYQPRGASPLEKAVDLLAFGGYVSWYLAAIRKVNPALIPTVDALKAELAKR